MLESQTKWFQTERNRFCIQKCTAKPVLFGLELLPNLLFLGRLKTEPFISVWALYMVQTQCLK